MSDRYEIRSDGPGHVTIPGLALDHIGAPASRGEVVQALFHRTDGVESFINHEWENAVGATCTVVWHRDGGSTVQRGGAVNSVDPIRVSLGGDWEPAS